VEGGRSSKGKRAATDEEDTIGQDDKGKKKSRSTKKTKTSTNTHKETGDEVVKVKEEKVDDVEMKVVKVKVEKGSRVGARSSDRLKKSMSSLSVADVGK
jgi:hypothetical protein